MHQNWMHLSHLQGKKKHLCRRPVKRAQAHDEVKRQNYRGDPTGLSFRWLVDRPPIRRRHQSLTSAKPQPKQTEHHRFGEFPECGSSRPYREDVPECVQDSFSKHLANREGPPASSQSSLRDEAMRTERV